MKIKIFKEAEKKEPEVYLTLHENSRGEVCLVVCESDGDINFSANILSITKEGTLKIFRGIQGIGTDGLKLDGTGTINFDHASEIPESYKKL